MRQLTKKEKEIMEFFWNRGPMFIRELQGCYEKEPNFSTLSTQVHTLQVDGFQKVSADVLGTLDIGSEVECEFETGLRTYSFDGVITELNWTGNKDDVAGYSMTIQSKGEITKSTTT